MNLEQTILDYLNAVDSGLEILSEHSEGKITGLPSWVLDTREIIIGITEDSEGIVLKVTPSENIDEDVASIKIVKNIKDINEIISPMNYGGPLPNKQPENNFLLVADMSIVEVGNPLAVPALDNRFLIGWGRKKGFLNTFNIVKAKKEAIELWNSAVEGTKKGQSFIQETRNVFSKLQAIIKRKAFLERRIHRFINDYPRLLLPSHKRCLYEYELYLGQEMRKADFILEREQGLPSILIELESPVHKVITKANDLTAPANHARQQISEWVSFIEKDPMRNASGENSFLTGPKDRLVVIGKGVADRERLIDTKFDGVTFWTYSMLLEEARTRLNNHIASQYKLLGLEEVKPF
jgi:hypothetical protein